MVLPYLAIRMTNVSGTDGNGARQSQTHTLQTTDHWDAERPGRVTDIKDYHWIGYAGHDTGWTRHNATNWPWLHYGCCCLCAKQAVSAAAAEFALWQPVARDRLLTSDHIPRTPPLS
ncbi:uncharacterized protein CANTADRAFT_337297 [Suhomyces tanzawaensis NRRL Y-17324]|uniref:Uncharacterized protein n=1 Tax=Suhomyces tanzawaensis NRRL Y-17324 TaxID=984487 RepID=A0A1E4SBN9_9ASCO|nr:uncharacterized protein CANTADRAFT_337297 [Suhomyces tanzawaensis NRRL Y-17324]ODV76911.1 hypothetical protein CANTADRAFT_337297 [Suhomyces tanzawaensis NRRL Y-17324]